MSKKNPSFEIAALLHSLKNARISKLRAFLFNEVGLMLSFLQSYVSFCIQNPRISTEILLKIRCFSVLIVVVEFLRPCIYSLFNLHTTTGCKLSSGTPIFPHFSGFAQISFDCYKALRSKNSHTFQMSVSRRVRCLLI